MGAISDEEAGHTGLHRTHGGSTWVGGPWCGPDTVSPTRQALLDELAQCKAERGQLLSAAIGVVDSPTDELRERAVVVLRGLVDGMVPVPEREQR